MPSARVRDIPAVLADPRVPAPDFTGHRVACRTDPDQWHPAHYGSHPSIEVRQAIRACKQCPFSRACLLYALANPALTKDGIWAATSPHVRAQLRTRLRARLGDDWVGAVTGKATSAA